MLSGWARFIRAMATLLALCLAGTATAQDATAVATALGRFASDKIPDIEAAVQGLVASGAPKAGPVLEALNDSRLFYDPSTKAIFYKDTTGAGFDAATGAAVASLPDGLKAVKVNNRIRRAIEAAQGSMTMMSADPAKRIESAESAFKTRDPAALPAIAAALESEKDPAVRRALESAKAAILVFKKDVPDVDRLAAIAAIRELGTQDALSLLRSLPADTSAVLLDAANTGATAIEHELALWNLAQNVWFGLSLGSVLLLAAIGLAITFGVMGVINMAHGEMVMIGAYATFVVQEVIRAHFPALFDYSLFIALPVAFCVAGLIGIIIERGIIRFLYGRPLETLLATWGVSLILQQAVRTIFGPTNREVGAPAFMSASYQLGGLAITQNRLWIIVFSMLVFAALLVVLRRTRFGVEMRAVTQNRRMAAAVGVRTNRIDALTFGLGSGIAGLAGVALSQIDNVSPNLGQSYIIDSFMVVVFGGVGNLWGTLVGAMSIGVANKLLEPYAGAVLGKIILLVLVILFIQKRPRGLFALKGRAVEN